MRAVEIRYEAETRLDCKGGGGIINEEVERVDIYSFPKGTLSIDKRMLVSIL